MDPQNQQAMSRERFMISDAATLKTATPKQFFKEFQHKEYEMGVELEHLRTDRELQFIPVSKADLVLFCMVHSIQTITYFTGGDSVFVVFLSMKSQS